MSDDSQPEHLTQSVQEGALHGIAIRKKPRGAMLLLEAVDVHRKEGLQGDFRGTHPRRQVTVLSHEAWREACAEIDAPLPWHTRRANLLVEGLKLRDTKGHRLNIGEVELEITGETDPCHRMDEAMDGLQAALLPDWRGGVLCKVITPGHIKVGDSALLLPPLSDER